MLDRYDQDLLLDYLEGELDADRRAKLDAMLADDPQLAGLLSEMAMDRAALRSLPEAQAPADLVHDVTKTLERRMLLDEPIDETGPIPLSRGRGMAPEPARSISWGRVVGLTGLAASVALAAGIVVITIQDPRLDRTAADLAASPTPETANEVEEAAIAEDASPAATTLEGFASELNRGATDIARPAAALSGDLAAGTIEKRQPGIDAEALALAPESPATRQPLPPATVAPELTFPGDTEAAQPLASFAFGSTAAISVIQPRQQLVLLTESPEVSLEHLFEFCVANGIPIVQPNEQASFKKPEGLGFNSRPGAIDEATPTKDTDETFGDYALLINESQLDTLVQSLNTDITLEPNQAGKGSLISNQAAVLAELPEKTSQRYGAARARQARTLEQESADDQAEPATANYYEHTEQQAVQLRLPPDLGSDYANSRNAYNLKLTKQQGAYAQEEPIAAVAEPVDRPDSLLADAAPDQLDSVEDANRPNATPREAKTALAETPDSEAERASVAAGAAADDRSSEGNAPVPAAAIDPTRGNWLSAHLPVANTTPLLLQWRTEQSAKPTSLVPITIKRAEPDKVNTLRKQQQVELATRRNNLEDKAEVQPAEADKPVEAEPAAETAPPADADPAE